MTKREIFEPDELSESTKECIYRYLIAIEEEGVFFDCEKMKDIIWHFDHEYYLKTGKIRDWYEIVETKK